MYGGRSYGSSSYGGLIEAKSLRIFKAGALGIGASVNDPVVFVEEVTANLAIGATLHAPVVTAVNKSIVIKVNTVDISDQVNFNSLNVSNNLYSEPDIASFEIIKSTNKSYTPAAGDEVEVIDTGVTIFKGLLVKISKEMQGFSELFMLEFRDWTEELANIIIAEDYTNQTVNQIIADINTTYLTGYDITNVADTTVVAGIAFDNISVVEALDQLAELSGKNWYVSPDKEIYFFANGVVSSPFDLTDTNGKYEYKSLRIDEDLTQIRNKVTVKGSGIAAVTVEDLTSQAAYGIREYFERDNEVNATNEATQKANAILSAYKDSIKIVNFRTKTPGLFAGQQIDVDSTLRGINETLNIESVEFQSETAMRFVYSVRATTQRLGRIEDLFKKADEETDITPAIGDQGSLQTIEFSAIDDETIQWSSGSIITSDGTVYSISADASETLTGDHIIYFDPAVSTTVLQISTTFSDGIGQGKIPLAYATKSAVATKGASIFPIGFGGRMQIDGGVHITDRSIIADNIAANAITANEIAANTITANEMNVGTLSAISADLGTITAGVINGTTITGATIRTAATGYRVVMDSANGVRFYNGATQVGYIQADASASLVIQTSDNIYFREDAGTELAQIKSTGLHLPSSKGIYFTSGTTITDEGSNMKIDRALKVAGDVYPSTDGARNCGASDKEWSECWADAYNGASSISKKINILNITNVLDKVVQLEPVTFEWKKDSKKSLGLILEEMQDLFPELIASDIDGNPAGINYGKLPIFLLGALKELNNKVETMKNMSKG